MNINVLSQLVGSGARASISNAFKSTSNTVHVHVSLSIKQQAHAEKVLQPKLRQDCLRLAAGAEVALEALAEAARVVADATARAVAAEVVALAEQHVRARRALLERAVRAAGAQIAHTAHVLVGVPRRRVSLGGKACERSTCPGNCNNRGRCIKQEQLAYEASKTYSSPWDANKHVGCVCDLSARGPDCSLEECPS